MGFCFAVSFYFSCNNKVSICNSVNYRYRVVVATAKVQIFKQITTHRRVFVNKISCCCYRKGTNFQANHNFVKQEVSQSVVVVATAKVQIFKQITTGVVHGHLPDLLLLLPQRYKFSSKSQHIHYTLVANQCCCCYRKGTNFQANHNHPKRNLATNPVVVATAKVQIFKQITTTLCIGNLLDTLLLLPQRYKFSSKSQQKEIEKRTIKVVVATAKVQIFKQITTLTMLVSVMPGCCCYRKGTNFQANHNHFY